MVFLDAARSVIEALTSQGFGLDEDPEELDAEDFVRSLFYYGAASVIDFFIGMAIFYLIWSKNHSQHNSMK